MSPLSPNSRRLRDVVLATCIFVLPPSVGAEDRAEAREEAALMLAYCGAEGIGELIAASRSSDAETRWFAVRALGEFVEEGGGVDTRHLSGVASDPDPMVREAALYCIRAGSNGGAQLPRGVLEPLVELACTGPNETRVVALNTLAELGPIAQQAEARLIESFQASPRLRQLIIETLSKIGGANGFEALVLRHLDEPGVDIGRTLLAAARCGAKSTKLVRRARERLRKDEDMDAAIALVYWNEDLSIAVPRATLAVSGPTPVRDAVIALRRASIAASILVEECIARRIPANTWDDIFRNLGSSFAGKARRALLRKMPASSPANLEMCVILARVLAPTPEISAFVERLLVSQDFRAADQVLRVAHREDVIRRFFGSTDGATALAATRRARELGMELDRSSFRSQIQHSHARVRHEAAFCASESPSLAMNELDTIITRIATEPSDAIARTLCYAAFLGASAKEWPQGRFPMEPVAPNLIFQTIFDGENIPKNAATRFTAAFDGERLDFHAGGVAHGQMSQEKLMFLRRRLASGSKKSALISIALAGPPCAPLLPQLTPLLTDPIYRRLALRAIAAIGSRSEKLAKRVAATMAPGRDTDETLRTLTSVALSSESIAMRVVQTAAWDDTDNVPRRMTLIVKALASLGEPGRKAKRKLVSDCASAMRRN